MTIDEMMDEYKYGTKEERTVVPTTDHGDGWQAPYKVLVTDATGAVMIERVAEDLKVEVPPWTPCQTREDVWEWLRDPYGGGGPRYPGWLRLWIHCSSAGEEQNSA